MFYSFKDDRKSAIIFVFVFLYLALPVPFHPFHMSDFFSLSLVLNNNVYLPVYLFPYVSPAPTQNTHPQTSLCLSFLIFSAH